MVSILPLISNSSSLSSKSFWMVPKAPVTSDNIVNLMFDSLFSSLARSLCFLSFHFSFIFPLWSAGTTKSTIRKVLFRIFFFFVHYRYARSSDLDQVSNMYLQIPDDFKFLIHKVNSSLCIYNGKILVSCTILSVSPSQPVVPGGRPRGVMVKAMDCEIVINTLGKGMNTLSSQLWVK